MRAGNRVGRDGRVVRSGRDAQGVDGGEEDGLIEVVLATFVGEEGRSAGGGRRRAGTPRLTQKRSAVAASESSGVRAPAEDMAWAIIASKTARSVLGARRT